MKRKKISKVLFEKKMREEKKIQKKNILGLSPTEVCLCVSFSSLIIKSNPIISRNLFLVCSLSLRFSLDTKSANYQRLFSVFCSVPFVFCYGFRKRYSFTTTRESEIYTHTEDTTNVATDDDERTISKSKVGTVLRAL